MNQKTITPEQESAIRAKVFSMTLPAGIGDKENACSIAAINLALTGTLTDAIPRCMSRVIGKWIICAQDRMSSEIRNSERWKSLLPMAAGTGRNHQDEQARIQLILADMWERMELVQPWAEKRGYGHAWKKMTTLRTATSAREAKNAAYATADAAAAAAAAYATADAAYAAANAAAAAVAAAYAADAADDAKYNPCDLLEKLIAA